LRRTCQLELQGGIAHGRSETNNPADVHADYGIEGMGVGDGRAGQSPARAIPGAGRRMDEGLDNHPGEVRRCLMLFDRVGAVKMIVLAVAILVALGGWGAGVLAGESERVVEYKCYDIPPGPAVGQEVTLIDQFHPEPEGEVVTVQQPLYLCNPAAKIMNGVRFENPNVPHLKCYKIVPSRAVKKEVTLTDQFHPGTEDEPGETVTITTPRFMCTEVVKTEE
jgi:hypothetical protein